MRLGRFLPRRSLFLKVYLTLIGCLVVVAIAGAVLARIGMDERDRGWSGRRDAFIVAMLPADAAEGERRIVLTRLSAALDADIAIFDRDGRPVDAVGTPIPPEVIGGRDGRRHSDGSKLYVSHLPDGRTVAARFHGPFIPGPRNPLVWLLTIAVAIGVAAYPIVRHLTRRLERLRVAADAWGAGALETRAETGGSDEVAAVAASFNAAADRIARQIEAHRSLLANASHELRSPLARLRMAIELFGHDGSAATKAEIETSLSELDALVEEILLASRLDHIGGLERSEPVDLLALAAEEGARHGLQPRGEAAFVLGDARLLARLVRNLIQNAFRHGRPPVEIHVRSGDAGVELSVRDHGDGIAAQDAGRIFEPFYRPSGRSEQAGGWGLGLALVRRIAEHHRATARYEPAVGGGARFVVTFPVAPTGPGRP